MTSTNLPQDNNGTTETMTEKLIGLGLVTIGFCYLALTEPLDLWREWRWNKRRWPRIGELPMLIALLVLCGCDQNRVQQGPTFVGDKLFFTQSFAAFRLDIAMGPQPIAPSLKRIAPALPPMPGNITERK